MSAASDPSDVSSVQFRACIMVSAVDWGTKFVFKKKKRQNSVYLLSLDDFACDVFHFQNGKYRYVPLISFLPVPEYQTFSNSKRRCFFHTSWNYSIHVFIHLSWNDGSNNVNLKVKCWTPVIFIYRLFLGRFSCGDTNCWSSECWRSKWCLSHFSSWQTVLWMTFSYFFF